MKHTRADGGRRGANTGTFAGAIQPGLTGRTWLRAFDKRTGKLLWETTLPASGLRRYTW